MTSLSLSLVIGGSQLRAIITLRDDMGSKYV